MTLLDFVRAHYGKYVEWDQNPGKQCTDLVEMYHHQVVDPSAGPLGGNAIDFWTGDHSGHYKKVSNTPSNYPSPGDIIVWHEFPALGISQYGHTAVVLDADADTLLTYDQNWPDGSPPGVVLHQDYSGVAGWLHPRKWVPL